jgi:serine/threonine-protein kinase
VSQLQDRLQHALGDAYRIERELGGGGMSRVFLAVEQSLNRHVVIKLLMPELTSEASTARFKRELELTALLQHPHILPVLGTGARDGLLYYVMPYVEGESLRHRMQRAGRLPVRDVVGILSELLGALAYAHDRGVVHRDIKPENILLSNDVAVLADFGIAAVLAGPQSPGVSEPAARLTEVGMAMGTPGYMSPEQAAGEQNLDARSDLYALAVVGYEMLSGQPPFVGDTPLAVLTAHLTATPKPVEELRADTPPALAAALAKALSKNPDERFQNARAFRDALGIAVGRNHRPSRRRTTAALLGGVAVVAAVAAFMLGRDDAAPALDPALVANAPFDVLSSDLAMWQEGMVDILAANLDGAGPIRTVAPAVSVRKWKGNSDRQSVADFGRATGAGFAVVGRIVPSGADSVRLTARVIDVASASERSAIDLVEASSRMDRLADSLSLRVLRELGETVVLGATRRSSIGSASPTAIKAFLQGEQHYRRSDWDSAAVYYRRAIESDSTFAPALRHLSNAMGWKTAAAGTAETAGYDYALRAGELNHGLAPRESLLVAGDSIFAALILDQAGQRDVPDAEERSLARRLFALLRRGTEAFPDDPELWFKLGDSQYHLWFYFPSTESLSASRDAFDRSLALDSAFAPSYVHLIDLAVRQQDIAGAQRYIRQYLALHPIDVHAASARLMGDLLDPAKAQSISLDSVIRNESPQVIGTVYGGLLLLADTAETQLRIARALQAATEGGGAEQYKQMAKFAMVNANALRGHYREAMSLADSTGAWITVEAALVGVIPPDSADRLFASWARQPDPAGARSFAVFWLAARRDTASLKAFVSRMPGADPRGEAMRGLLDLARGDTTRALERLAVPDSLCLGDCSLIRLPVARIHAARHEWAAAAAILDQEPPFPLRALWMLERGRVNEALGRTATAIDSYSYVANAWAKGDPELKPYVDEARERLATLSPDATKGRSK